MTRAAPTSGAKKPGTPTTVRGNRRLIGLTLPEELIARVATQATKETRSRANMIEVMLLEGLERRQTPEKDVVARREAQRRGRAA